MNRLISVCGGLIALMFVLASFPVLAEDDPAANAAKPAKKEAEQTPAAKAPYRKLAPGVMKTIDPMRTLEETVSRHDVVGLLAVDPKFDWAKDIAFRRDVWVLEFQFKPMRMIWVDVPQPERIHAAEADLVHGLRGHQSRARSCTRSKT